MKGNKRRVLAFIMAAVMLVMVFAGCSKVGNKKETTEEVFASWHQDAASLQTLIDYVEDVTDEKSENFIPVENRIATFDMDGTICGELFPTYLEYYMLAWRVLKDPNCKPDEETIRVAEMIRDEGISHNFPDDMAILHAQAAAKAYSGMTLEEFSDFTTEILLRDVDGFEGMTYAEAFYLPMVEVIEYLQENGFSVYVVSGSDRFICRNLFEGVIDIPSENFIGMDVFLEAEGQNGENGLDYEIKPGEKVVRTDKLIIKNLQMNKVSQIMQEIGKKPVLAFGNSSGDTSMLLYATTDNPYKSAAFMLIADDEERDYGNTEKGLELKEKWEGYGFNVISMKNDFATIYGENVKKTGTFRWMEELK